MNQKEVKKRNLKSNIWKTYLFEISSGMFFSVPIMVLFWQENGLSLTEIMILQSIFAIFTVILEIPTGYFADIYGRKKALIIAGVVGPLAITTYSLGHNFVHFIIAEFLFALSNSFVSGTMPAFLYDTLTEINEEKKYKHVWGHLLFYGMIAMALSNVIGGFIAKIDLRYTLYATIPFFSLMIPLALSLQEPKRHKLIFEKGYVRELKKIIKTTFVQNKKLRWMILYSGIIFAFNQAALWLYQPYFKLSGLDIVYFGIVFASFQLVAAFSSKYAHKLEEKIGKRYSLIMLIFLVTVSYFLMSNFIFLFSFSFCYIQQFIRGFKGVIITDYVNQLTSSHIRATVLSIENFAGKLLYATIIPLLGWVADVYSLKQALVVMSITTLITGMLILIILKKDKII